ncbi:hypothetical protein Tco_1512951 [Tanacetum coccineum]
MIAPGSSRYSSNDMVHNHYLEEAKKKTQESGRNSRPSVMPYARSQSTTNGSKPKPRSNTQTSRNWPASKSSFVTTKTVPIAEHSRNSRNFSESKYFCLLDMSEISELRIHDHNNEPSSSKLVQKVVPPVDKITTSEQELELLFSPMYEEYFNAGNPSVSKSSALSDNLQQHDTQPTTNIHPTLEPIIPPSNNNVEDNK